MSTRSDLSPSAAAGIWAVSMIGSWTMALAILGTINEAVIGCDSDSAPSVIGDGVGGGVGGGAGGWLIMVVAALVPVMVMVAVAPAALRVRLIGLAVIAALVGLAVANTWIGPCL